MVAKVPYIVFEIMLGINKLMTVMVMVVVKL